MESRGGGGGGVEYWWRRGGVRMVKGDGVGIEGWGVGMV